MTFGQQEAASGGKTSSPPFDVHTIKETSEPTSVERKPVTAEQLGLDPAAAIRALREQAKQIVEENFAVNDVRNNKPMRDALIKAVQDSFGGTPLGTAVLAHIKTLMENSPEDLAEDPYLSMQITNLYANFASDDMVGANNHRGLWQENAEYRVGESVYHNGLKYFCIKRCKNVPHPPLLNNMHWMRETPEMKTAADSAAKPTFQIRYFGEYSPKTPYVFGTVCTLRGELWFCNLSIGEERTTCNPTKSQYEWEPYDERRHLEHADHPHGLPYFRKVLAAKPPLPTHAAWKQGNVYAPGDVVSHQNNLYLCRLPIPISYGAPHTNDKAWKPYDFIPPPDPEGAPGWSSEAVPDDGLLPTSDPRCTICGSDDSTLLITLPIYNHFREPDGSIVTKTSIILRELRACQSCQTTIADFIVSKTHPHLS